MRACKRQRLRLTLVPRMYESSSRKRTSGVKRNLTFLPICLRTYLSTCSTTTRASRVRLPVFCFAELGASCGVAGRDTQRVRTTVGVVTCVWFSSGSLLCAAMRVQLSANETRIRVP